MLLVEERVDPIPPLLTGVNDVHGETVDVDAPMTVSESLSFSSAASGKHLINRGELLRNEEFPPLLPKILFFFIVGTMCSSKCSIAIDDMSRNSCSSS